MLRKIIQIDEEKCNGCGLCAEACHEGAIAMVDGKAKLMRDDYCDGLGDCLPGCPTGAITFVEREAAAYDEAAVLESKKKKMQAQGMSIPAHIPTGCPGSQMKQFHRDAAGSQSPCSGQAAAQSVSSCSGQTAAQSVSSCSGQTAAQSVSSCSGQAAAQSASSGFAGAGVQPQPVASQLSQWPVQIKLAPINAPYFSGANLLIAADCSAYAYGSFHQDFIRGKVTLIGCPKLDAVDYSEKLTEIIKQNDIKSVTIVRMEVPCCGGLEHAAVTALKNSGKFIPWQVVVISTDGRILDR